MKKVMILVSAIVLTASAATAAYVGSQKSSGLFEANVEALSRQELDNTHMYLWWVKDHGDGAITCTYGGDDPC